MKRDFQDPPRKPNRKNGSMRVLHQAGIIAICFGLVFGGIGAVGLVKEVGKHLRWAEVSATVSTFYSEGYDEDISYHGTYDYEYDGQAYKNVSMQALNSNMYVGQQVNLLVDPQNPLRHTTGGYGLFILYGMFFAAGALMLVFGVRFVLKARDNKKTWQATQGHQGNLPYGGDPEIINR